MNKSELVSAIAKESRLTRNSKGEPGIPPDVMEWDDDLAFVKVKLGKKKFKALLLVTELAEGIGLYELASKLGLLEECEKC